LPPYSLSSQLRHNLLLAVNEAFTNALKHSKATQVDVFIVHNASAFEIAIADNGHGFDPALIKSQSIDSPGTGGDGLHNMKQRLADIGGLCSISSESGRGTTVQFLLPAAKLKEEKIS